jgi:multidrug resistance efflux pump
MPEKEDNKIEIRSEEIQDILGQVPHWIIRWGTVVVLVTVLIILAGSYLFHYPDIRRAAIVVTTENPPSTLVARTDGQIEKLFVSDSQFVRINTVLVVLENPASYSDVISLRFDIAEIRTTISSLGADEFVTLHNNYKLGDIQTVYAEFVSRYQDYYQFLALDYYAKTIQSKREEIRRYQQYAGRLRSQSRILLQDFELAGRQYSRDSDLFVQGYNAAVDLERSQQEKLKKQLAYEESNTRLSETEIQISQLNQQVLDLELKAQEEKEQKQAGVREAFEKLVAGIDQWEQKYLLIAPLDGIVTFPAYWSENQNVRTGDKVLTIIPKEQGDIIGKLNLPVEGAGKVRPGQRVNIQFANFPHLEYGMVKGTVRSISQVPYDQQYSVEVELPEGLTTYYGREIPFTQEMPGRAEIITEDRRLIERIISPLRSMLTKQSQSGKSSKL